jgi:uncharacterized protein YecE (DUF72 family)
MGADLRIGISGWTYAGWKGRFYPEKLPQRRHLEYASRRFNSIEINGSFYSLQGARNYQSWYDQTPAGFVFAVKGSRFITHNKKLGDVELALGNFFASGVLLLREKLGPFLWQVSDSLRFRPERVDEFLGRLPRNHGEIAAAARTHGPQVRGKEHLDAEGDWPVRHALEVRHESFFTPELAELARRHRVALVFSDSASWRYLEEVTADFIYIRLHGSTQTYASGYGPKSVERWAERIRAWAAGGEPADAERISERPLPKRKRRDVYVYFDNDQKVYAPRDARRLMGELGVSPPQDTAS